MKKIFLIILVFALSFSIKSFAQTEIELIGNNSFEEGLTGWNFYSLDPAAANYNLDENSVISGKNSVHVNIIHAYKGYPSGRISLNTQVNIESGTEYTVSFKVRANKPIQGNAIWWAFYDTVETNSYYNGIWGQVKLDADTTIAYQAHFTSDFTDTDVLFSIDFAGVQSDSIDIWIDDVSLTKIGDDPEEKPLPNGTDLITNSTFMNGLDGWNFYSLDSAAAKYQLDESGVLRGGNSVLVYIDQAYKGYPSGRISLNTQVDIKTGRKYYIRFKVRSDKPIQGNAIWWAFYDTVETNSYYNGMWGQVKLDADTTVTYEAEFTADFTDPDVRFSIDFAGVQSDSIKIWLDDIHLVELNLDDEEAPLPDGTDLITNTGFNDGLSNWDFYSLDSIAANYQLDDTGVLNGPNSVLVYVDQAYKGYPSGRISLNTEVPIQSDKKYYIRFKVRSDKPIQGNGIWWAFYDTVETNSYYNGMWGQVKLDADTTVIYETEFTADFTDPDVRFSIDFAGVQSDSIKIWLDDIHLVELKEPESRDELPLPEGTELLSNNYFDDGLTGWDINLSVQSAATLVLDNSGALESDNSAKVHIKSIYSSGSWKNQFRQQKLLGSLIEGNSYHVQYQIKSNKNVSGIYGVIQQLHGSFNDIYSKEISLLADSAVTVVDTFVCAETDSVVAWAFNLGTISVKDVDFWFDAVHLIDLGKIVGVEEKDALPTVYALNQNYPNPFNPTTVISFALPKTSDVQLSVYNILGEKVTELVNTKMVAGNHTINFNAGNLASGMYIYRIKAGNFVSVKKMMLLK